MLASSKSVTLAILAGVTASTFVAASPATAQENEIVIRGVAPGTNMRLVSYRDLNLNFIAHRKILNDRVGRAVRDVCEFSGTRDTLDANYNACSNAAWRGAWPQISRAYVAAAQLAYYRHR